MPFEKGHRLSVGHGRPAGMSKRQELEHFLNVEMTTLEGKEMTYWEAFQRVVAKKGIDNGDNYMLNLIAKTLIGEKSEHNLTGNLDISPLAKMLRESAADEKKDV